MKDRIKKFIDYKGVSPGDLAEITEVQRSNISHIFNGRNKPGALFIEKFLLAFPDINARWLMTGEGSMLDKKSSDEIPLNLPEQEVRSEPDVVYGKEKKVTNENKKQVEKIVMFYSDGTFYMYNSKNPY